jgi:hypothetical protein
LGKGWGKVVWGKVVWGKVAFAILGKSLWGNVVWGKDVEPSWHILKNSEKY